MSPLSNEQINVATWKIPSPLAIVGSSYDGQFNGMTASWITQLSMDPVLIGVGIDNKSLTHKLMTNNLNFSLNFFSNDYTKVFVKFSKPAEYSEGYLNSEPIWLTDNKIPIFKNAVMWIELKTKEMKDLGTHTLYIGEFSNCETKEGDFKVAYMGDTRMKYGGVPRGGH